MRKLLIAVAAVFAVFLAGCRGTPGDYVVSGSAYVESERPEGRAVAKVEVQYRPPVEKHGAAFIPPAPAAATLGSPEPISP